jgi:hypothetical protein
MTDRRRRLCGEKLLHFHKLLICAVTRRSETDETVLSESLTQHVAKPLIVDRRSGDERVADQQDNWLNRGDCPGG